MTATYDDTLPTAKDRIRAAVGDTDMTAALRTDEHIASVLALNVGDETAATADVAAGLAVEYAQRPDRISDDGTSISWGERVKTWLTLAETSRAAAVATTAASATITYFMRYGVAGTEDEYDPDRIPGFP